MKFGVADQTDQTEKYRSDLMAYAEICFAQAKTGEILELDMQKRFLDHSENAKGIPCNTYIPDSDIKKLVKVYEAIIV